MKLVLLQKPLHSKLHLKLELNNCPLISMLLKENEKKKAAEVADEVAVVVTEAVAAAAAEKMSTVMVHKDLDHLVMVPVSKDLHHLMRMKIVMLFSHKDEEEAPEVTVKNL